jgi:putative ubiquitin-RnfH superfamily antitoxin RatB of RatAB toxin-antitoxin module
MQQENGMNDRSPEGVADLSLKVEVAYATPAQQVIVQLQLAPGATVAQAIDASGLRQQFAEIALHPVVGIFSRKVPLDYVLNSGDRVEIYRPLLIDPKLSRRQKVELERKEQSRVGKQAAFQARTGDK